VGKSATAIGCDTVTVALADLLVSAVLVAVTVYVPPDKGAVYRPLVDTLPPEAVQTTAVFMVPDTEAENCC